MAAPSSTPFRDGFAAVWHEPVLLPAELVWRWCFGFAAIGLGIVAAALFLDSLKVSRLDQFLLSTMQPRLLWNALQHIVRGSLSRFVLEQTVLLIGVTLLWAFASAAGRAATLRRLVAMFRAGEEPPAEKWHFGAIFVLQLLRAIWSLVAVTIALGSFLFGVVMMQNGHALRAALALSFGVGLALLAGMLLNWFFGLAALFCVRNGLAGIEALEQAVAFASRLGGRLWLLWAGFFLLRLLWAGTMCLAFFSPLNWREQIGAHGILLVMAGVALVYFAGDDWLHLSRLAAYVSLAEDDSHPLASVENAPPPQAAPVVEMAPLLGLA